MSHRLLADWRGAFRHQLLGLAVLALLAVRPAVAVEAAAPDDAFVGDYCASCPDDVSKNGRLDPTGLASDRGRNEPPPNPFVSILQRIRIEDTRFGPSTGTIADRR